MNFLYTVKNRSYHYSPSLASIVAVAETDIRVLVSFELDLSILTKHYKNNGND